MRVIILTICVTLTILYTVDAKHNGYCIGNQCYAAFRDQVDFATAQKHCESNNGHLMTVRSSVSQEIFTILIDITGDYWIGLQLPTGQCPDSASDLRGYKWITGDNKTDFQNWGVVDDVCTSKCVSVSKDEFKWIEKPCNRKIDGYLCEYVFPSVCKPLEKKADESVLYETPLGFKINGLLVLPMGSIATLTPLEFKYICISEHWIQAPWDCKVLKGGCDNECVSIDEKHACICPYGKTLQYNNRSCEVVKNDPCLNFGCAQICYQKNDNSVSCVCHHGYALTGDGKKCEDIDECLTETQCPGKHHGCVNTIGGFECRCQTGFERMNDRCVDIDECSDGPCEHKCTNVIGSYYCSCFDGYVASKDPNKCQLYCPFEECLAECDPNDRNQCNCPDGYVADERDDKIFCVDIDECEMDYCDQICHNTNGSYLCSCREGFYLVMGSKCFKREPSNFTTPSVTMIPITTYPTQQPAARPPVGLLVIIVCSVVGVLSIVFLLYHILKRRGILDVPGPPKNDGNDERQDDVIMCVTDQK